MLENLHIAYDLRHDLVKDKILEVLALHKISAHPVTIKTIKNDAPVPDIVITDATDLSGDTNSISRPFLVLRITHAADDDNAAPLYDSEVTVPFRAGECLEKLKHLAHAHNLKDLSSTYIIGQYVFDPSLMTLHDKKKKSTEEIKLTEKERDILLLLIKEKGHVIGREALLESVWGYRGDINTHTVETHIYRLRQKIEKDPSSPEIVLTEGEGYLIEK